MSGEAPEKRQERDQMEVAGLAFGPRWAHLLALEFGDRKINQGLGDEYFEVRYLERGR